MKHLFKFTTCLMIALAICAGGLCTHTHDSECGYNSQVDDGCQHVHQLNEWDPPI